jgi:hypothetical protein
MSLCDQTIERTGESCACKIVSKLNVRPVKKNALLPEFFVKGHAFVQRRCEVIPFHRVNSPLEAPVTSRRPSGVHAIEKIGHLILLVADLTYLVVTAFVELSNCIAGGTVSGP